MPRSSIPIPFKLWMISGATGAGAFMAMLDSTVVHLGLGEIQTELGAALMQVQWISTAYLIAMAAALPLSGWASRRFGTRAAWLTSTVLFLLSSVACALAPSANMLILARVLQGMAAGLMVPLGQAILGQNAEPNQLGRIFGTVGFAVALGPALGPAVAGLLIEFQSWRWIFWINVPFGAVALGLAWWCFPPDRSRLREPLDYFGFILASCGLALLMIGAASSRVTMVVLGVGLVVLFITRTLRSPSPLVELRLFNRREYRAASLICTFTSAAMYGGLLLLPLWLHDRVGLPALAAGLMIMVMGLGSAASLPIAGYLSDRFSRRSICMAGGIALAIGTAALGMAATGPVVLIAVLLFARGVGLAFAQMPATAAAYSDASRSQMGDAATLLNMAQRIGGAVGSIAVAAAMAASPGDYKLGILIAVLLVLPVIFLRLPR